MLRARFHRRQFLRNAALIAMAPTIPAFLRRAARAAEVRQDGRILVVLQLDGGNDGVNTVVPYADEGYAKHRDQLRLRTEQLIKVNDQVGLHPALRPAADLLEDGRLAIVQGVGYPNPNRSHEVSMAIWRTARMDREEHQTFGWIGRALDEGAAPPDGAPHAVLVGEDAPPIALRGRRCTAVSLAAADDLKLKAGAELPSLSVSDVGDDLLLFARRAALDARSTADLLDEATKNRADNAVSYPATALAGRLKTIAQLIKAGFSTPVYYAIQPGYDTHAVQLPTHARLLGELSGAIQAFLDDLQAAGLADRVLVLGFSEFGRRVQENASLGADHGTAGPVLLAGAAVRPGLIGQPPSLTDLIDGDLKVQIDFRQVYAAILEDWLGLPSTAALGGDFDCLPIFKNAFCVSEK